MINCCIIGCGNSAHLIDKNINKSKNFYSHLSVLFKNKKFKILCCSDNNQKNLNTFAKNFKDIRKYTDYKKMFKENNQIQLVILLTPATTHYEMCKEIASLGAKVMHPLSILPCEIKLIPIIVKSSFSDSDGTVISNFNDSKKIIAIQNDVTLFNIRSENMWNAYGFVTDIFRKFSELHIDISIITTSQFSISTTTNEKNIYQLNKVYQKLKSKYECEMTNGCTVISIISDNIFDKISKLKFDKLEPEIIHIGSNNLSVNLVFKNKTKNNIKEIINSI
jgi:hypothetical protein